MIGNTLYMFSYTFSVICGPQKGLKWQNTQFHYKLKIRDHEIVQILEFYIIYLGRNS